MSAKKQRQERKLERAEGIKQKRLMSFDYEFSKNILSGLFYLAGAIVAVYELVNYFRHDTSTFIWMTPVILIGVAVITLIQQFRKNKVFPRPLFSFLLIGLALTVLLWQVYQNIREDKFIVLFATFDGPEETYGVRDQVLEQLRPEIKDYKNLEVIASDIKVTSSQGSDFAREIGKKKKADVVIWAWYRPTENPNINIHIENLNPKEIQAFKESESYQPEATIQDLESFEIQKQVSAETTNLVSFLLGYVGLEAGDCEKALMGFDKITRSESQTPLVDLEPVLIVSAACHFSLGQNEDAIKNYNQLIQMNPNNAFAYSNRGGLYNANNKFDLAIEDFNKAIQLDPNNENSYNGRGVSYYKLGLLQQALIDYDKAIQFDSKYFFAYTNRGSVYNRLGQFERAIEDYDQAIKINPNNLMAYNNRGGLYNNLQQFERAIEDYNKAIKLDPKSATAYGNRCFSYLQLDQYKQAEKDCTKAIQNDPSYLLPYYNRGFVYYGLGNYEKAIDDFTHMIQENPEFADAYLGRGYCYRKLGKNTEAEIDISKYEELTGEAVP